MKFIFYSTVIASVLLFTTSCRGKKGLNLSHTNAKGEVPTMGNLTFRFNKSLLGSNTDSVINQWADEELMSFEPAIPGRFRWSGPDEVVFSPAKPLQPATTYKVSFNRSLFKYSAYDKVNSEEPVEFHTPYLNTEGLNVFWQMQDAASRSVAPQLDVYFNYNVHPEKLKEHLKVTVDDQPADFALTTLNPGKKISMRLLNVKAADKDFTARIQIKKGLVPENGKNGTPEEENTSVNIPSPYVVSIQNMTAEHDGTAGVVKVVTSQQPVMSELQQYVSISGMDVAGKGGPSAGGTGLKYTFEAAEDGFFIRSENFNIEQSYQLTLKQGLRGVLNGTLKDDYTNNIVFGQLEPSISFVNSKGLYLSRNGLQNVEVKVNNIGKVKVVVSKIYESNLMQADRSGYYPRESSDNEEEGEYEYDSYSSSTIGDVIYEKVIETKNLQRYGQSRLFKLNLADRLPEFKGIYHVMIRSTEDYWLKDSRMISLSDIGLITKEGRDKIVVFANSIKTTDPLSGVNVVAYGSNNQVLAMGSTNSDGAAELAYTRKEFAGFKPAMIIAKTDNDFNYLPFNTTGVNTSRFDVGGKRIRSSGLDAFIYAERDIYRPGEKLNYSVIVRDKQWQSPGDIPVKLRMTLPNGKELKTIRKALNDQGSVEGNLDISKAALTGTYSLEVYSSNDVLLSSKNFMVEEFVPDRIKVSAKLGKPALSPGDSTNLSVSAVNYFGPPAANRNYECEIQLSAKEFRPDPKKFGKYDFNLANQNSFFDKVVRQGNTDANGNAQEGYSVPVTYRNIGLLEAGFYATVFDENSRPVSRSTNADIFTQDVFFGIGDDGYGYYPLNVPVKFPVIAVSKDEKAVNADAKLQVIKHEYRTVLSKTGSYYRYESQRTDKVVKDVTINIKGENNTYPFTPTTSGDYEIRLYVPGANAYVSKNFYSYGNWGSDNTSFEVNNEGHVDISVDKEKYNAGETVKALFKAPFNGKMLVTYESDQVIKYQYINTKERAAELNIKLGKEHLPNFYITATLIKPHEVSDIPLTVAHGYYNVKVDDKGRQMGVDITASKTARSKTHQKVSIKAAPNSMVTLSAVDNGVLAISNFKTPDPYQYFYERRALQVSGYDLYPLLFPELRQRLSSTGGDGGLEMDKRVNPVQGNRFKVVSFWSGMKKANGSGNVDFEFDVPQFSGEIRLMAVAYKDESFGAREQTMTIADPVVLSTALPRFFSPGDTVNVPVTITNTTSKAATATAQLKVSGPLQVNGASQQVNLPANGEAKVNFKVTAAQAIGLGKAIVEVNSMGEKFVDETEITVRPASTLQKQFGSGSINGGASQSIALKLNDFIPGTTDYKLVVSKSPALELARELSNLVQYPYGCTEQTISAAFPQLYYGELADAMNLNKDKGSANGNIQEAIRKIKMRQLYNGSVTLWDGEGREDWWTTVYAAHFLIEASRAGFEVDNNLKETMLGYLINRLKNRETIMYYYNRDQNKKIAPKEVAYSLYVLALAGCPQVSTMNYYKAAPALLALDSRYLISAAYAQAGDKGKFKELMPGAFAGEASVTQTGGSFYSEVRDEAIALNALMDVEPGNPQVPVMAKHISEKLKQRRWLSTQEQAFSFLALGKIAKAANASNVTADVKVNGKVVGKFDNKELVLDAKTLGTGNIEIATKGSGRLYYYWQAEGVSATGSYKEEDSYLKVRRQFYDRFGKPISGNTFRQNDLVVVKITVEKSYSDNIDNVVLTDLLPACFEIENPRVKELPGMDWVKDASTPQALDIRDDRIHFFTNVWGKENYYYAVRVVAPGNFKMGPVSADAMYNAEYHSYNGGGVVRVVQ
jgi:alpha-2-macroglobulin